MPSRRSASAVWPTAATAAAAVVMSLLAVPAYGQKRLCQTPTPTLDGGRCTAKRSVCEVRLEIDYMLTLTKSDTTGLFVQDYGIYKERGGQPLTEEELEDVVIADGVHPYRLVTVINGSMPGPCLKFYTNQTVKFHVVNNLPSESLTIHWHGLDMFNNSYMDGVALVSQCPIQPGATFVYTVKARQPGSYWYHSHIGAQRSMGILGPLVVHDPNAEAMPERVMVLQDWNHDFTSDRVELGSYEFNNAGGKMEKLKPTKSLDGAEFSAFPFQSGLINGRGRHLTTSGGFAVQTPLEIFEVEQGVSYRFRVIGAGVIHPFRVSVEGHRMTVVASDAHDFEPVAAESFIINPGERFDFILVANQTVGNYMILAQTLEVGLPIEGSHVAEAVLHYSNAPAATELMKRDHYLPVNGADRGCLDSNPCVVVNCPYSYHPEEDNTRCVHLGDLTTGNFGGRAPDSSNIKQIFLNFGFPGEGPASINGIEFQRTPVAAILHPDSLPNRCSSCGPDQLCQCTHTVKLERNRVHQIVLLNMGSGSGFAHPVHIHGYSFYVVKMGYPVYDNATGMQLKDNEDVACEDDFCNVAGWRNQSWEPSDVQGLNLLNPVRKDTIIVPTDGYVIVRLKADNPGMWFVHCHIELHHLGGMALILDGSQGGLPAPPPGFPDCGNFPTTKTTKGDSSSCGGYELWQILVVGVLCAVLGIVFGIAGTCACVWCRDRGKK